MASNFMNKVLDLWIECPKMILLGKVFGTGDENHSTNKNIHLKNILA